MFRQNTELLDLISPVVQGLGYELLGIEQTGIGKDTLLRIFIDCETGIGLQDCERVSDGVTGVLDIKDPIKGPYRLEVSSPGFDRPLFTLAHFARFCGHKVSVRLEQKINGRQKLTGKILAVEEEQVVISTDDADYVVAAGNINRAHLVPD